MRKFLQKAYALPSMIAIALVLVVIVAKLKPGIQHEGPQFPTTTVEVITVKKLPFRNRSFAYGHVEPAVSLKARTEISGKISYIHPALKKGASLAKGTVVLRIEPTTFEFSLEQNKAGLNNSLSLLEQLRVEEESTQRSLKLARESLQIGQEELKRFQALWEKRVVTRSTIDNEEQKVIQLRQHVEDLEGKITSYVSRKAATEAQIKKSRTQLAQSEDTLIRTEIILPFDARIGTVSVEKGEFVAVSNLLFEALGIKAVEINAQMPINRFFPLVLGLTKEEVNLQSPEGIQSSFAKMRLGATVTLVGSNHTPAKWKGELLRIGEAIDPTRDTLSLVVAVNNPYEDVIPGVRPPLLKGMFVAIEFYTEPRELLVLPRKAIHQGRVYVATADNVLEIRPITILHTQSDMVIVGTGIAEGERVIITDIIPVIDGLPLDPVLASEFEQQLAKKALGAESFIADVPTERAQ